MAVAAECLQEVEIQESYAHSMRTIQRMGRLAVEQAVDLMECEQSVEAAYEDFTTQLGEMLKTDPEFAGVLDIERAYSLAVVGGQARWSNTGEPMVALLERGVATALESATADSRMLTQVVRDEADVRNAKAVDCLLPGEARIGISMYPKDAMARDGVEYWHGKGYRKGLAFFQYYAKTVDGVEAGSFSFDVTDEAVLREVLANWGMHIPAGISSDKWLDHALTASMSPADAKDLVRRMRAEFYDQTGLQTPRLSITEYIAAQDVMVRQYFESLVVPMAISLHTGDMHEDIARLVDATITTSAEKLKPEVRNRLERILVRGQFGVDAAREVDGLIRYAVVEELRKGLVQRSHSGSDGARDAYDYPQNAPLPYDLVAGAAHNIQIGVAAGREYGGCSSTRLAEQALLQDIYGGLADGERAASGPEDQYGSLHFECPKGHSNMRKPNEIVFECQKCGIDVSCGKKRPESPKRKTAITRKNIGKMTLFTTKAARPELTKV